MRSQVIWLECSKQEKFERTIKNKDVKPRKSGWTPPDYATTIMRTGYNKSGPGRRIRAAMEKAKAAGPAEFVYKT